MGAVRSVRLRIWRGRPGLTSYFNEYDVQVSEDAYVIDAIEKVWKEKEPRLLFRHACHHASCGTCGIRINGVERLPCVTPLSALPLGKPIILEPLRNFPWVGDLVVDVTGLMTRMAELGAPLTRSTSEDDTAHQRFESCIECGLCVSACPISAIDPGYLGPAVLAAAERILSEPRGLDPQAALELALGKGGVWRCRNAYQCTEVCPQAVDPAGAIGRIRRWALFTALGRSQLPKTELASSEKS